MNAATPFLFFAADWLLLWVFHQKSQQTEVDVNKSETEESSGELLGGLGNDTMHHQKDLAWNDNVREFFELRFANLMDYCIPAFCVSYFFFFAIGGYLHVSERDKKESQIELGLTFSKCKFYY